MLVKLSKLRPMLPARLTSLPCDFATTTFDCLMRLPRLSARLSLNTGHI